MSSSSISDLAYEITTTGSKVWVTGEASLKIACWDDSELARTKQLLSNVNCQVEYKQMHKGSEYQHWLVYAKLMETA